MPAASPDATAQRVLVYGVTGSGKSTAAERIGAATGLPVTLVDELTWRPGWVPLDEEEQRRLMAQVVAADRWVLDSAYGAWLDVVLPRVQLVVALDYPRWLSLQRLVRRTVAGAVTKTPRCNGNTESFRHMVGPSSILRWHFRSFRRKQKRMRRWTEAPDGPPVLLLKTPRALDEWIAQLRPEEHRSPGTPV